MSILKSVSNSILSKVTLYVKLRKNEIDVKCIDNGKMISRKSTVSFSNDRLIITDNEIAETFLKELINELLENENSLIKKPIHIVLQIFDKSIKEITPTEKRIYQDFAFFGGFEAKYYTLIEHQQLLTDQEILNVIK